METIKRLPFLLFPLLILVSCGKDSADDIPGGVIPGDGQGNITFEIAFADHSGSATAGAPRTRVSTDDGFTSAWEDGDQIGIYAVTHGQTLAANSSGNYIHNAKLTYSTTNGGQWLQETALYWPIISSGINSLDFYAYYPYDATATDPTAISFNVMSDQNGTTNFGGAERAGYNLSDLLTANSDNAGSGFGKGDLVSLTFFHALAMVEVVLEDPYGEIDTELKLSVALCNVHTGATLELGGSTTTDTGVNRGDINMFRVEQQGTSDYHTTYTFRALVPAQTLAQGANFAFITNGDVELRSSSLTADVNLVAGQAERFIQKIPISMDLVQPEANCYMVEPWSRGVLIPVSQANRVRGVDGLGADFTGLNPVEKDNFSVELVWGDRPVGPEGIVVRVEPIEIGGVGYILVKPGSEGNAVIGIKLDDETDYRWSWHIWVTDKVSYATDIVTGLTWMDRSLGAANNGYSASGIKGLFYQWGRKDAFPGSNGTNNYNQGYYISSAQTGTTANPANASLTKLEDMVKNPLSIASNINTYLGSLNENVNNDSWGAITGAKTIYDPCPDGWRVPPVMTGGVNTWGNKNPSEWEEFVDNGRRFRGVSGNPDLDHFYPALGYRNYMGGALMNVGVIGYYWAASCNGTTIGNCLHFNSGTVNPVMQASKVMVFPVRCVK